MKLFAFRKQATVLVPGEPSLIYEVLTDYDNYFEWMPNVTQSKLLAKESDLALAELQVVGLREEKVVLECIHSKNRMVIGRTITVTIPSARLEWEIAAGEAGQCRVTLTIEGEPDWRWLLPLYRGLLNAPELLKALRSYLSAFLPELALSDQSGQKVLEILETSEGLIVWVRGRKYTLQATAP